MHRTGSAGDVGGRTGRLHALMAADGTARGRRHGRTLARERRGDRRRTDRRRRRLLRSPPASLVRRRTSSCATARSSRISQPGRATAAAADASDAPAPRRRRRRRRRPRRRREPARDAAAAPTTAPADATFPPADPAAKNFLITGADNGACVDPDSPYAGAFGDARRTSRRAQRHDHGLPRRPGGRPRRRAVVPPRPLRRRSPTPATSRGSTRRTERDDPQRLIDTIYENFGDRASTTTSRSTSARSRRSSTPSAASSVPFEYPARDPNTGLNVPDDRVLHVRRRATPWPTCGRGTTSTRTRPGSGNWQSDGTSRPRAHLAPAGLPAPHAVERARQGPAQPERRPRPDQRRDRSDVVTDGELTPAKLMEFAGVMNDVEPDSILDLPDRGDAAGTINGGVGARAPASTATTCRRCWRCSAARRRWPTCPSRCSGHDHGRAARGHHHDRRRHRGQRRVGAERLDGGRPCRLDRVDNGARRRRCPATRRPSPRCRRARRSRTPSASPRPATSTC